MEPLSQAFFARGVDVVAQDLLGRYLVRDRGTPTELVLRITEVEAYGGPEDTAAHCRMGRTPRNAPMWGPPGHAYIYLCYGLHQMLNIVTSEEGCAEAVLVRSCEPVSGLAVLHARRGAKKTGPVLLTGPGKVGAALALDRSFSGAPLYLPGSLEVHAGEPAGATKILCGPRIGIDYATVQDRRALRRFAVAGSPWVSHSRGLRRPRDRG
jgi:DNA-3-methyladenine glycosylase